ncbi:MAG: hemolysin family protein [Verrucomicrobiota bacterium]
MNEPSNQLLVVLLLLLANGVFATAEIALVSARKSKLEDLADEGDPRAAAALRAAKNPNRFLSAIQLGLILMTVLAGAFCAPGLAARLAAAIGDWPLLGDYARPLAFALVVGAITLAAVVSELIPRRVATRYPEQFAVALTRVINVFAVLVSPVVVLLDRTADILLKPFGFTKGHAEAVISDEEVNSLIQQGLHAGVFNKAETDMVAGVLELDQLPVTALMTPRPKIVYLNIDDPDEVNWRKIVASGHSRFPVYQSNRDQVLGMVTVKAIWANSAFGLTTNLRNLMAAPLVVPETMMSAQLLEQFKKTGQHGALVADEFGSIQGMVTLIDVMEAIVGDLPERGRRENPEARKRDDGSWLMDATLPMIELKELLDLDELPHEEDADFQSLGGLMMTYFGRIPREGDTFDYEGWRFEVIDMDRHRVDKVLVSQVPAEPAEAAEEKIAG